MLKKITEIMVLIIALSVLCVMLVILGKIYFYGEIVLLEPNIIILFSEFMLLAFAFIIISIYTIKEILNLKWGK